MSRNQKNNSEERLPAGDTGNASNPSPRNQDWEPSANQLLGEQAQTYLHEAGNIEDLPDAQDMQQMEEKIRKEK